MPVTDAEVGRAVVGDLVTLRLPIAETHLPTNIGERRIVAVEFDGCKRWFNGDWIDAIEPRPIEVGDRVKARDGAHFSGEVLAVVGGKAWVFWDRGTTPVGYNSTLNDTVWTVEKLVRA